MSQPDEQGQPPRTPVWEPVAIILAILALIPKIYARDALYADVLMYAAGAVMVVVFVLKVRRLRALWKYQKRRK
ncbi:MAG: hypothetical protein R6V58_01560 [Planctomycetota bacterium]